VFDLPPEVKLAMVAHTNGGDAAELPLVPGIFHALGGQCP
jgi:hypothetical protein